MATGSIERTDLYRIWNTVQNTQLSFPRDLIIDVLRDEFSRDSYYRFVADPYGYPLAPDHTDMPLEAGIQDDITTRLWIGAPYHFDVIFYPAILVRTGGSSSTPLSFNRNRETIKYEPTVVLDGYGNKGIFSTPTHYVFAGAWEGNILVDIFTRDILTRDNLVSLCNLLFTDIRFEQIQRAGVVIKKSSASSPTESEDRQDKLYKQTITLDIRTEWRREIPVETVADAVSICVDFGRTDNDPPVIAPNLTVNTSIELIDEINQLS